MLNRSFLDLEKWQISGVLLQKNPSSRSREVPRDCVVHLGKAAKLFFTFMILFLCSRRCGTLSLRIHDMALAFTKRNGAEEASGIKPTHSRRGCCVREGSVSGRYALARVPSCSQRRNFGPVEDCSSLSRRRTHLVRI